MAFPTQFAGQFLQELPFRADVATLTSFLNANPSAYPARNDMPTSACSEPIDVDMPPCAAAAPCAAPDAGPLVFEFSGDGAEYFRIWIVNWLLTVATLGIYSAWAKTRRLQYFYRNTRLAGAGFDFRGDPRAILRGRILAAAMLGALYAAFGVSIVDGAVAGTVVLAALPFIIRSALRFRLANTWYRGLPFGFGGTLGKAYLVYLLPLATPFVSDVGGALAPDSPLGYCIIPPYLCWPWMHGAMKRYQHSHLVYGGQQAGFPLSARALARPYVRIIVVLVLAVIALLLLSVGLVRTGAQSPEAWDPVFNTTFNVYGYLFVLLGLPLTAVRMTNLAWSATTFPGVRIECDIGPGAYLRLQAVNWLLTLLTLGLFRPFAAVRTWRYRLACVRVHAPDGLALAAPYSAPATRAAAGDGLADLLSVDLSW